MHMEPGSQGGTVQSLLASFSEDSDPRVRTSALQALVGDEKKQSCYSFYFIVLNVEQLPVIFQLLRLSDLDESVHSFEFGKENLLSRILEKYSQTEHQFLQGICLNFYFRNNINTTSQ